MVDLLANLTAAGKLSWLILEVIIYKCSTAGLKVPFISTPAQRRASVSTGINVRGMRGRLSSTPFCVRVHRRGK